MTTEWVSGGGNHFRHHRFTKNGFSLDDIHLVTRKQEIFQNYNKNWQFFHMTTKWVSGGGNQFCQHDFMKNVFPVVEIHFVNRKQGIYLNSNLTLLFF